MKTTLLFCAALSFLGLCAAQAQDELGMKLVKYDVGELVIAAACEGEEATLHLGDNVIAINGQSLIGISRRQGSNVFHLLPYGELTVQHDNETRKLRMCPNNGRPLTAQTTSVDAGCVKR